MNCPRPNVSCINSLISSSSVLFHTMQDDNHGAAHEQQSWAPTSCKLAFVATFSKIKYTNFAFKKIWD